jgi:excinuclease ABC subunit C
MNEDIKSLAKYPTRPGIYQMIDTAGDVLYVGKAKNLKKRISSYFQRTITDSKIQSMMDQIQEIKITITSNDNEALLLESNLIKKLKPRYNVVLRDDKSYPYIYLSDHVDFPRMDIYRGPKTGKGRYFGPFPSAWAVRETLALLQKIFKIRQCTDHFFKIRTRPCLQFFIDRCTAPCVGFVDVETYQRNVKLTVLFLEGKNNEVIEYLANKMEEAAQNLNYEEAARYRDQITSLRRLQEQQAIIGELGDVDIIGVVAKSGLICIEVMYVRGGRLIGNKDYFPKIPAGTSTEEALSAFLPQYYLDSARGDVIPQQIILNCKLEDKTWIEAALSQQIGQKISISDHVRGPAGKWMNLAVINAEHALMGHLAGKISFYDKFEALQKELKLANLPRRLECFDVSHTFGEATVASCVVFDVDGPLKKDYRRFNIKGVKKGDDYGALTQALLRRYTRLKAGEAPLPDILIIDGGKGQLALAEKVLEDLQVSGVIILAIAKGPGRKPGLETLYISGRKEAVNLKPDASALHVLQQIRDEAHRFAIIGHRKQRAKTRTTSPLESIPGIGAKRRRELLRQFGGLQELQRASIDDLAKVPGINYDLARRIYEFLHGK